MSPAIMFPADIYFPTGGATSEEIARILALEGEIQIAAGVYSTPTYMTIQSNFITDQYWGAGHTGLYVCFLISII